MRLVKTGSLLGVFILSLIILMAPAHSVRAVAELPTISAIYVTSGVPASANSGTTTTVTVTGANLTGVTEVSFYLDSVLDPLITSFNIKPDRYIPESKFKVDILTAAGALAGARNVKVTTPSGASAAFTNGFTIYRATVTISTPGLVLPGSTFWVNINVANAANLNASQIDLIYDSSVIQVTGDENTVGVTDGVTNGTIPEGGTVGNYTQVGWSFQSPNSIRVLGHMAGVSTVNGSGYLHRINFLAKGAINTSSNIILSNFGMWNNNSYPIVPDTISNGFIAVGNLAISNTSLPDAVVNAPYSGAVMSATGGTSPYTWSASGLPPGLTLGAATGIISGTPITAGNYSLVAITVQDSTSPPNSITKSLSLNVYPALHITNPILREATVNKSYPATPLTASGGKTPYIWSASGLPTGLVMSAAGVISGTPTVSGTANVNISVTDSFSPANADNISLALQVYPALQISTGALPDGIIGINYSQPVVAGGGKSPYAWSSSGLPPGLTLGSTTGIISGTPIAAGNYSSVMITVQDSFSPQNSTTQTLAINVHPVLHIINSTLPGATVNKSYPATTLTASGGKTPYTWSISGLPDGLVMSAAGVISGTPTVSGTANVNISVADSFSPVNTDNISLSLQVYLALQINTGALPDGVIGISYSQPVVAGGGKSPYTWSATGLPAGLSMGPTSGIIGGTPGALGNFQVSITVTDALSPANAMTADLPLHVGLGARGVNLSLQPATNNVNLGSNFNIAIQADAGQLQVQGVEAYITFDPAILDVVDADGAQPGIQIIPGSALNTVLTNSVNISSGLISYCSRKLNSPFPTDNFTLATIQFHAKAGTFSSAAISFSTGGTGATTLVDFGGVNITGSLTGAALNVNADTPLYLDPASVTGISSQQTFDMDIKTNLAGSQQASGVQAYINFDPAKLEVVDADSGQTGVQITSGSSLSTVLQNTVDNTNGLISFSAGKLGAPYPAGVFNVATIQFRAKTVTAALTTPVTISLSGTSTTSMVDLGGLAIAGTHANASVQLVPGANVNFSLVLQGGARLEGGWVVPLTVKLFTPGTIAPTDILAASPVYTFDLITAKSGSVAIAQANGVPPGTYDISVVSPHCLINVKRSVVIAAPSTNVNLGTLLEGNANDDAVINIQDFGLLAAAYGKQSGQSGFDARVDFDRSGTINIADFGLLAADYGKHSPLAVP